MFFSPFLFCANSILHRAGVRFYFHSLKKSKTKTKNGGDGRPNIIFEVKRRKQNDNS
jgi:hypothetical protein